MDTYLGKWLKIKPPSLKLRTAKGKSPRLVIKTAEVSWVMRNKNMKVFIENEAGYDQKNLYNEKTLEYKKTVTVSRKYPFPYGFILGTTSGDGDNLDCFIITEQKLKTGQTIECEPIGLMEQIEDGEEDHNILAKLHGEEVMIEEVKSKLTEFVSHVFDHKIGKIVKVGRFLGKEDAEKYIEKCLDSVRFR